MDVITAARKLGAALQEEEAYKRFTEVSTANDNNKNLQSKIGEFNIIRMNLDNELNKDEKDEEKVKKLNFDLRNLYDEIMKMPEMVAYNEAKSAMDKMMNDINSIIMMCAQGQDPETCEISSCTGNCGSCGGCH